MKQELASVVFGITGGLTGASFLGVILSIAGTFAMAFFSAVFSYMGILAVKAVIKRYSKKEVQNAKK